MKKKMKNFKDFFGGIFGGSSKAEAREPDKGNAPGDRPVAGLGAERLPGITYKKDDFIGQKYEVYGILGIGGFGVVYLVYSRETAEVYALKTFRDEYLEDAQTRERFRKEAKVWVDLERHPYLVRAYFVDEVAGRLYIAMEYITPDEQGLNSLDGYLERRPPDLAQSLRWSIQFCHGMEYAYSRGIRCHRDIKPANIMISRDKTVKISDFGLASVFGISRAISGINLSIQQGRVGLSGQTIEGAGFGTPTHMPSEQFTNAAGCDERSDIYSFGIVMYQTTAGGKFPFLAPLPRDNSEEEAQRFWRAMYRLHSEAPVPRLNSPLFPIIQHCLEKKPGKRYQTFKELRKDFELLLKRQTGEVIKPPELKDLEAWEWNNKGGSLYRLGRIDEAIRCYDKALELDPRNANIWLDKGVNLHSLGRFGEAIHCYDRALELDPQDAYTWNNKGISLYRLGRFDESIRYYDKALEIDPRYAYAWYNKGNSLCSLGQYDEAIRCYDKALELDPRHARIWNNKGVSLRSLGRIDEAIRCYDKALELDPPAPEAWNNKGYSLHSLGQYDEAIRCFNRALELDPQDAAAWFNNALAEEKLGRMRDAARSFQQFIALAPTQYAAQIEYAHQRLRELKGR